MASLVLWIRNKSVQKLGIALSCSLLLHWILLGKLQLNLFEPEPSHTLEARLVLPPPPTVKPASEKPITKKEPQSAKKPRQSRALPSPPPDVIQPQVDELPPDTILPNQAMPPDATTLPSVDDEVSHGEEVAEEIATLEVNSHPYQWVETTFDVRTELDATVNTSAAGKAKITFELSQQNTQYQIKSVMQAKGLAALFIGDLLQTSQGVVTPAGLQPQHYLYRFDQNKNKTFSADFDWQSNTLSLNKAGASKQVKLEAGSQDLLSFMYQFMFVAPLQTMQLYITNGKKLALYDYSFEGEVQIDTKMGSLNTIHLQRVAIEDEKTDLWLALDYQYLPVKIRKTEKDGKVYELLVTQLNVTPSP